jgi:hypothetical protein
LPASAPYKPLLAACAVLAALASFALVPGLSAQRANTALSLDVKSTILVSTTPGGNTPNGPSRDAVISADERLGAAVAFESDASNIRPGDRNGRTDVFVIQRKRPYGRNGTAWRAGRTEMASVTPGNRAGNGHSYNPSVDGAPRENPTCVAFVSRASNLVRGDTNRRADVFVRYFKKNRTIRVSLSSTRRQANGDSFDASVNGDCTRVAFTSNANNLALTRTRDKNRRPYVTSRPRGRRKQVYVHVIRGKSTGRTRTLKGMTFLASASTSRRAGNGNSFDPVFANQAGKAVAFTSTSTNLSSGDRNRRNDVYERLMPLGKKFRTRLVSATRSGRAGNGPSSDATVNGNGEIVSYSTTATNLLAGDSGRTSDVGWVDFRRSRRARRISSVRGAALRPSLSDAGTFVLFDAPSAQGLRDVFIWTKSRGANEIVSQRFSGRQSSLNPYTSARGNYVLFESGNGSSHQIYLAYLGPK